MLVDGFVLSRCIGTAAVLGVADQLAGGPRSAQELAGAIGADADALARMMGILVSAGVFAQDAEGRFLLNPLGETLRSDAPGSLYGWARYIGSDWYWQIWSFFPQTIRNGRTIHENIHHQRFFEWYGKNPEYGRLFDEAMRSVSGGVVPAVMAGYDFSGLGSLVDVAGGQGTLISSILAANPGLKGTLFDMPAVIQRSRASGHLGELEKAGRLELVEGDLFKALPAGKDAYLFKWIIHDWTDAESKQILSVCRQAMKGPQSKLLLVEMVLPEDNSPSPARSLDIAMLALTGGRERTVAQYRELLASAGFKLQRVVPTPSPFSVLEAVPA